MSQVNFFMLEADEREFVEMLLKRGDTHVFLDRFFSTAVPEPLSTVPSFGSSKEITLLSALLRLNPQATTRGGGEYRGMHTFAPLYDPSCEFSRCYFEQSILITGRLYAKIGWLRDAAENKIYESWYRSLERWLKKRYRNHRNWWFAPSAEEWSLKGGEVCYGTYLPGSLVESLREPKAV